MPGAGTSTAEAAITRRLCDAFTRHIKPGLSRVDIRTALRADPLDFVEPWDIPTRRPRRRRKPSAARLIAKGKKLGVDVTVQPSGAVTFNTGNAAAKPEPDLDAELAEWVARHAH